MSEYVHLTNKMTIDPLLLQIFYVVHFMNFHSGNGNIVHTNIDVFECCKTILNNIIHSRTSKFRKFYMDSSKKCHPDRPGGNKEVQAQLNELFEKVSCEAEYERIQLIYSDGLTYGNFNEAHTHFSEKYMVDGKLRCLYNNTEGFLADPPAVNETEPTREHSPLLLQLSLLQKSSSDDAPIPNHPETGVLDATMLSSKKGPNDSKKKAHIQKKRKTHKKKKFGKLKKKPTEFGKIPDTTSLLYSKAWTPDYKLNVQYINYLFQEKDDDTSKIKDCKKKLRETKYMKAVINQIKRGRMTYKNAVVKHDGAISLKEISGGYHEQMLEQLSPLNQYILQKKSYHRPVFNCISSIMEHEIKKVRALRNGIQTKHAEQNG